MPLGSLVSQLVYKPNVKINPDDLVTQTTAAKMRGVSLQAIEGLVRRGKFKLIIIDGHKFVFRSEVEKYQPSAGGRPKQQGTKKGTRKR
jgi:hypothetical protein